MEDISDCLCDKVAVMFLMQNFMGIFLSQLFPENVVL